MGSEGRNKILEKAITTAIRTRAISTVDTLKEVEAKRTAAADVAAAKQLMSEIEQSQIDIKDRRASEQTQKSDVNALVAKSAAAKIQAEVTMDETKISLWDAKIRNAHIEKKKALLALQTKQHNEKARIDAMPEDAQ